MAGDFFEGFRWERPKRDDERAARRWRGSLFDDFRSPIMWKDEYFEMLRPPHAVTFPICGICGHVIWNWPHFEEPVPEKAMCDACYRSEQESG